jgi:hypothetical protein
MLETSSAQPAADKSASSASVPVAPACFTAGNSQYVVAFESATNNTAGAFPYAINDYGVTVASPVQFEFIGPSELTLSRGVGVGALVIERRPDASTIDLKHAGGLQGKKRRLMGAEIGLAAMLLSSSTARKASSVDLTAQGSAQDHLSEQRSFAPADRPTWLVQPNEDLVQLAAMLFGLPEVGWLIADLNQSAIKETYVNGSRVVELRADQRIELPVRQDILDFQKIGAPHQANSMITVVDQTQALGLMAFSTP